MKIAICVPSWPPGFSANGIVTYASYLVPALRALGHEVFILTRETRTEKDDPHVIDLRRFAPSTTSWRRAAWRLAPNSSFHRLGISSLVSALRELTKGHKIDVLEIEESFGWPSEISQLKMLPVVVRLHGPWFLNGKIR